MVENNRKAIRIEKALCVTIQRVAAGPELRRPVDAAACDVSLNGIGVVADESFEPDTKVIVTIYFNFETDDGRFCSAEGIVRSCTPEGDGKFRVGIVLGERPRHELQVWHDMLQRWRTFVT